MSQVIPSYQKPYLDIVLESENCSQPKYCSLIDMEVQLQKERLLEHASDEVCIHTLYSQTADIPPIGFICVVSLGLSSEHPKLHSKSVL